MHWPETIRRCFEADRVLYSGHARHEMRQEEFGPITDQELYDAICTGEVIETYPDDTPYPGVPLHAVCAYDSEADRVVIVTVYPPYPRRWEHYRRRKR